MTIAPGQRGQANASCPAGLRLLSGGGVWEGTPGANTPLLGSWPGTGGFNWFAEVFNGSATNQDFRVYVLCI